MKYKIPNGFLAVAISLFLASCDVPRCGENSEAVSYARSISKERLAELYSDMKKYHDTLGTPRDGWSSYGKSEEFPPEFSDLKVVRIRPLDANIMVEGCFDEYVYLTFEGLDKQSDEQSIVLSYPAHTDKPYETKEEVLWER